MFRTYHLRFIILMLIMCGVLGLPSVMAQDTLHEQPLLKMLANVPDNAVSRFEIYFDDHKAVELAFPAAKMPVDWTAFKAAQDDNGKTDLFKPLNLWWEIWHSQRSTKFGRGRYMHVSDTMQSPVGFDYFAVEQELSYGEPLKHALQLNGSFDLDKVRAALASKDFTQQNQASVEVWCSADGCDSGAQFIFRDGNLSNPFGGGIGQQWPIMVQSNTLIGSPSLDVIQSHAAVKNGSAKSLGDAPEYRAAVDALTQNGVLMQAYFWDGKILAATRRVSPRLAKLNPEERKQFIETALKDYEAIPVFKLLGFGDASSDSQQIGQVALVYNNEADAKQASAILPNRIANYVSSLTKFPFKDVLASQGVTETTINVVESSGQFVVLVAFAAPKPTIEQLEVMSLTENSTGVTPPESVYLFLVNSAIQNDIGWYSTIPRDVLEAAVK